MKRASMNGLFKRFYARHREKELARKLEYNTRINPAYGLTKLAEAIARGERPIEHLIKAARHALDRCDGGHENPCEQERRLQSSEGSVHGSEGTGQPDQGKCRDRKA